MERHRRRAVVSYVGTDSRWRSTRRLSGSLGLRSGADPGDGLHVAELESGSRAVDPGTLNRCGNGVQPTRAVAQCPTEVLHGGSEFVQCPVRVTEEPNGDDGVACDEPFELRRNRWLLCQGAGCCRSADAQREKCVSQATVGSMSPKRTPTIVETPGSCMVTP